MNSQVDFNQRHCYIAFMRIYTVPLLIIFLVLAGCCNFNGLDHCQPAPATYTLAQALAALQQQGVQVIQTGETFVVVVPSDQLFNENSANFRDDSILILEPLAYFLRAYETTLITVNGYTDDANSARWNQILSEQQARRMVADLSERGLDARMIIARGFGAARPVADNTIPSHTWWNRRIEIKFRAVVLPPLV